ncbi:hypothetical protein XENOCAPTIV_007940 [Xenoophorus captivus]|uniref:Uncharacterized protein n=1 Tax=Xenoophorus captivus TaxID=1517983 RepID=A0ABV0RVQ5_9TELE
MYHTAQRVLTVQLEAPLRPSLSVAKTSRDLDKIKSRFLKYTSGGRAINLPDCDRQDGRGRTPSEARAQLRGQRRWPILCMVLSTGCRSYMVPDTVRYSTCLSIIGPSPLIEFAFSWIQSSFQVITQHLCRTKGLPKCLQAELEVVDYAQMKVANVPNGPRIAAAVILTRLADDLVTAASWPTTASAWQSRFSHPDMHIDPQLNQE